MQISNQYTEDCLNLYQEAEKNEQTFKAFDVLPIG